MSKGASEGGGSEAGSEGVREGGSEGDSLGLNIPWSPNALLTYIKCSTQFPPYGLQHQYCGISSKQLLRTSCWDLKWSLHVHVLCKHGSQGSGMWSQGMVGVWSQDMYM